MMTARPSLDLRDDKGRAFCSPCGRSWDCIALVREARGCSFADAVRYLLEVSRMRHRGGVPNIGEAPARPAKPPDFCACDLFPYFREGA